MQPILRFSQVRRQLAGHELASNAFWSAVGEAVFRGTTLVTTVIVARLLGASDFGVFGLIRNGASQFGGLGSAGLGLTANRHLPALRAEETDRAGLLIGTSLALSTVLGLLLAAVGLAASNWIAGTLLGDAALAGAVRVGVCLVAIAGINGAQLGVLQGLEAYRPLALGYLAAGVVGGGALLAGSWLLGLPGALAGLAVMAVTNLLMFQLVIRRQILRHGVTVRLSGWRSLKPILIDFSLPTALIAVAIGPLRWLAESLLARSSGFAEAGLYYAGMIVFSLVVGLVTTLHSPLISILARRAATGAVGRLGWVSLYASWFAFLAIAVPLLLWPALPGLLLGEQYQDPAFVRLLLLILLYTGMQCYAQGLTRAIAQYGSMWFQLLLSVVESLVLLGGFLLLADLGSLGLACAAILSYAVRLAITLPVVALRRNLAPRMLADPLFLCSVLAFGAALGVQWLRAG